MIRNEELVKKRRERCTVTVAVIYWTWKLQSDVETEPREDWQGDRNDL